MKTFIAFVAVATLALAADKCSFDAPRFILEKQLEGTTKNAKNAEKPSWRNNTNMQV